MRPLFGIVLAGGIVLGLASSAKAQFNLTIGNPYAGGLAVGSGYYGGFGFPGYGYGYNAFAPGLGMTTYSSGYSGFVAPGTAILGTRYLGPAPFYGPGFGPGFGFRPNFGVPRYWGPRRAWGNRWVGRRW